MQTSISILSKIHGRSLMIARRCLSQKIPTKIQGIRENFSEYEVRLRFDQWLKSLWLTPNDWVHSTRDSVLRIRRYYIPFWNISFQGSVTCSLATKSNLPFKHDENYYSHKEWHSFPVKLDNVSLSNVNIYAAENLDRYHVQRLDVSFDTPDLIDLNENEYPIAPATVDQDAAFHHAWVLIMKPLLHNMCLEEGIKVYPKFEEPRIDSLHLNITSQECRLLYYPIYVLSYRYKSKSYYTCLCDGVTGHISGDRQFSLTKVTAATFTAFYPMVKLGIFSFASVANLLFAFELASEVTFTVLLPMALVIAPCVGFYARSYPKLYKKEISQIQWKRDQTRASKFTYDFIKPTLISQESSIDKPNTPL